MTKKQKKNKIIEMKTTISEIREDMALVENESVRLVLKKEIAHLTATINEYQKHVDQP